MKKSSPYISDPKLINRVRQYLDKENKEFMHVDAIVDSLQSTYSDYGRKKKSAFKKSVHKAYQIACQDLGIDISFTPKDVNNDKATVTSVKKRKTDQSQQKEEQCSDSAEFSDENEEYLEYKDSNAVNNLMSSMYKKSKKRLAHSAPVSAASSPKRPDTANQAPDLCKSLFIIDRSGNKKENVTDTLINGITSSTPRMSKSKSSSALFDEVSLVCESRSDKLGNIDEEEVTDSMNLISPGEVDRSFLEKQQNSKTSKADDVSIKSNTGTKKKKKSSEKESKKKTPELKLSSVTFADIGGNENVLKEVCKLLVHMKHPEVYRQLGVIPPRGFLLHGPPGCGKTLLANAIAGELQLPYIKIAATEVVSGVSGESEEKLRDIFDKAVQNSPCVLFIDEIDSITQKRENASKDMERRIVAQLLSCMDELNSKPEVQVLVIGATNRADSLDPALRRAGRFDREISMGIPGEAARKSILEVLCKGLRLFESFDYLHLARLTPGFVGADLMALAREAAIIAVNRVFNDLQQINKRVFPQVSENVPENKVLDTEENIKNIILNELEENTSSSRNVEQTVTGHNNSVESSVMENDNVKPTSFSHHCEKNIYMDIEENASSQNLEDKINCDINQTLPECSKENDYNLLLKWLKDQPPLSEEELKSLFITMLDFEAALKHVQPSAKREGFATIPDVTWDDIGALKDVRGELEMAILAPVRHPEQFLSLGLTNPPGILLAGPPGCGKTLLAKAVANESGLNFISVKGPELLNMYVGESERAVRQVFQRARNSAPCVIFFDELDALCPRRSGGSEGGSSVRVVNQLLTEMDGLEERKQVFIMGATNRPDIIDPAILRPGRLDKQLYVGLPAAQDRLDILNTLTKHGQKPKLSDDVNMNEVALDTKCECFTGADLAALVREASVIALKEYMTSPVKTRESVSVSMKHFQLALNKVKPSVSKKDMLVYNKMKETLDVS